MGEGEVGVVRVHSSNILSRGCTKDADDLHKLIDAAFAGKHGLSEQKFSENATDGPDIFKLQGMGHSGRVNKSQRQRSYKNIPIEVLYDVDPNISSGAL